LQKLTQTGEREEKAMNALIRIKNAAPVFVIALSLVTATATTTDVIFSFEEEEGEYADTDLETDTLETFTARQCLEESLGRHSFSTQPHT
jgi:hypothetical protein